jgi:aminoglycoside phosphotransferase (APT) family kinase protein
LDELDQLAGDVEGWLWERAIEAYPDFLHAMGERIGPERRAAFERVSQSWRNSGRPRCVVHGDAHVWNHLMPLEGGGPTVLVDWEDWRVAPPGDDLAFLIANSCPPEYRRRIERDLIERYAAAIGHLTAEEAWEEYRHGVANSLRMPVFWWTMSHEPSGWYPYHEVSWAAYEDLWP